MKTAGKTLFGALLLAAFGLFLSCKNDRASLDRQYHDTLIVQTDNIELYWETIEEGTTAERHRTCTTDEKAALSYLSRSRFKSMNSDGVILSYAGPVWMMVNGEKWFFLFNSIYPNSGSQHERFHPGEAVEFGAVDENGNLSLSGLVEWYKSRVSKGVEEQSD